MKTYPNVEKKFAYWRSTFDFISDKQNQETQTLKSFMIELEYAKMEEFIIVGN